MNKVKHCSVSLIIVILMSFYMQPVLAEEQPGKDNTYIQVARDQLSIAIDQYNEGDIAESKHSLKKASNWLNEAVSHSEYEKVRTEAESLASEIDSFRLTLNHSSGQNDIVRFWHQATSLVIRESEQLIHSYIDSSNDNTILRHLLDAKMHFFLAEHDLFYSHEMKDAIQELNISLEYLDQADAIARPGLEARINKLINNIKALVTLTESSKESWEKDEIIQSLDMAIKNVADAESLATPSNRSRLKSIQQDIDQLKSAIQKTNLKTRYDSIMSDFNRTIRNI